MKQTNKSLLDPIRNFVRKIIRQLARVLNNLTNGRLTPNTVTMLGLIAHIFIALFIATRHDFLAGILLIIFGLFDTLDGELARLQKRESSKGMLLDAVTDRYKEVMLYSAAGYNLVKNGQQYLAVWAIVACGASLSVSYVKAKGESAFAGKAKEGEKLNSLFKDGLMRFEVRMVILIIGLLTGYIGASIVIIGILSSFTAVSRLLRISNRLDEN